MASETKKTPPSFIAAKVKQREELLAAFEIFMQELADLKSTAPSDWPVDRKRSEEFEKEWQVELRVTWATASKPVIDFSDTSYDYITQIAPYNNQLPREPHPGKYIYLRIPVGYSADEVKSYIDWSQVFQGNALKKSKIASGKRTSTSELKEIFCLWQEGLPFSKIATRLNTKHGHKNVRDYADTCRKHVRDIIQIIDPPKRVRSKLKL